MEVHVPQREFSICMLDTHCRFKKNRGRTSYEIMVRVDRDGMFNAQFPEVTAIRELATEYLRSDYEETGRSTQSLWFLIAPGIPPEHRKAFLEQMARKIKIIPRTQVSSTRVERMK
jgi:hypothetical protein